MLAHRKEAASLSGRRRCRLAREIAASQAPTFKPAGRGRTGSRSKQTRGLRLASLASTLAYFRFAELRRCASNAFDRTATTFSAGSKQRRSKSGLRAAPRRTRLRARASGLACVRSGGCAGRWTANVERPLYRGSYLTSSNYCYGSHDSAAFFKTILHRRANLIAIGPTPFCKTTRRSRVVGMLSRGMLRSGCSDYQKVDP